MSPGRRPTGRAPVIAAATALAAAGCATGGGPSSRTGDSTGSGTASASSADTVDFGLDALAGTGNDFPLTITALD